MPKLSENKPWSLSVLQFSPLEMGQIIVLIFWSLQDHSMNYGTQRALHKYLLKWKLECCWDKRCRTRKSRMEKDIHSPHYGNLEKLVGFFFGCSWRRTPRIEFFPRRQEKWVWEIFMHSLRRPMTGDVLKDGFKTEINSLPKLAFSKIKSFSESVFLVFENSRILCF